MSLGIALGASVVNMEAHTAKKSRKEWSRGRPPSIRSSLWIESSIESSVPVCCCVRDGRPYRRVFTASIGQRCSLLWVSFLEETRQRQTRVAIEVWGSIVVDEVGAVESCLFRDVVHWASATSSPKAKQ